MTNPDFSLVLDRSSTAYAWITEDRLEWFNPSFSALAATLRETPDRLAESVNSDSKPITSGDETWRVLRHETPAGILVELIPGADPPAALPTDTLTGLLNRETIETEFLRRFAKRKDEPFALVFADLDDFKQVNDRHGHLIGDRCLGEVGNRLRQSVRAGDAVGRYGGDEFLILLSGVTDAGPLQPVRRRLQACVAETIEGAGWRAQLGLSVGTAFSTDGYENPEEMLAEADRRMYDDKRSSTAPPTDIADSAKLG